MSIDTHSLGEKVGPLPIGVWIVGIGGGIAAALYLRNRSSSTAAAAAPTTAGGTLPTSGDPASTEGGASAGSPYYQTGNEPAYAIDQIISRWTTNAAFNKAIAHDVQTGVTAAEHPPAKPKPKPHTPAHKGSTHHAPAHKPVHPHHPAPPHKHK